MEKGYIDIKNIYEAFDKIDIKGLTESLENENEDNDGIPYSQGDEIMSNSMETCKTQFGADFSKHNDPCPMLYYPADGDVVLSGTVPSLNNAKFQFRFKDSSFGCYLWSNSLVLNDDNIKKLSRINGVYKNWCQELETSEDIKPIGYNG